MLTKDLAICIRAVDYSETSQVVTFFTKSAGKIGAMAKGSRRPKSAFGGPLEVLTSGQIVFTSTGGEKLATLTEFEQHFAPRLDDFFVLNCCLFAAELVDSMTDDYDPHPELFDSFLQFLKNIRDSRSKSDTQALLVLFQLSLLGQIGLQPVLNRCVNCKISHEQLAASGETYFSSTANGLICRDCEINFADKIRLSKPAAICLTDLQKIATADEKTLNEIEKVLIYHFTELLHHPPRMAKYILKS